MQLAEMERLHFSCDLHDGLLQDLIAARMAVETLRIQWKTLSPSDVILQLALLETRLRNAVHEGRHWIGRLRGQSEAADASLDIMLHHMLTAVRAEWPKHLIIFDIDPDAKSIEFDRATKFSILRIAHESIRNAARHSGVDQILVSIDRNESNGTWQMEVVDQGKGFDVESLPEDHYGVLGMRLRAKLLGAELSIHSTPGKGTQVRLSVPLAIKR